MEKWRNGETELLENFGVPQFRLYLILEELVELVDLHVGLLSDVGCMS